MSDMGLIMESWREYKEFLLLEQRIVERRATWGDVKKYVAQADPRTWKNRLKKLGVGAGKAAMAIGAAGLAAKAAPAALAGLGISAVGPKVAAGLIEFMGDDVSTWTEEKVAEYFATGAEWLGKIVSAKAIMGAVDKLTNKTPLGRLNISDNITNLVDKKYEEAFYKFMNDWFKQNPNGPNNNPDEVIPRFWADKMFSKFLTDRAGVAVQAKIAGGGMDVS